jgi:D-alanyl-lipoteichoic acid acyltransferase DltB (MBOAT superfamily)
MQVQSGSGIYFVFVAAVFFVYWASTGSRLLRLAVILLANYLFCARFGLFYVLLLPVCSSLDFLIGLGLMRYSRPRTRALLVAASVTLNLAILILSRHMGLLLNRRWDAPSHAR